MVHLPQWGQGRSSKEPGAAQLVLGAHCQQIPARCCSWKMCDYDSRLQSQCRYYCCTLGLEDAVHSYRIGWAYAVGASAAQVQAGNLLVEGDSKRALGMAGRILVHSNSLDVEAFGELKIAKAVHQVTVPICLQAK